jgi:uncharacterized protein involved in response to NO
MIIEHNERRGVTEHLHVSAGTGPAPRAGRPGAALAAKGFRPFFLLAASFAAAILPLFMLALLGLVRPDAYLDVTSWHAHEMVFGFACAVIVGFLLTAVSNWTGRETVVGPPLLALAALWLAGRVALLTPGLPRSATAAIDLAFLPAAALVVARPLIAAGKRRNFVMIAVLVALWFTNLTIHLDVLGWLPGWRRRGALVAVDLVVLLSIVIAGRVVPMFTRNATGMTTIRSHPRLDVAAVVSMALLSICDLARPDSGAATLLAAAAAVFAAARAVHWGSRHVGREPLLWVLHVAYTWIPVGLALRVASHVTPAVPAVLAAHALTVGAIGGLTLGMMARVALGHTGRALHAPRSMTVAFALITLAAVVRVLGPLVDIRAYRASLFASGTLWTAAFALYLLVFAPILTAKRLDGKPG